MVARYSSLGGGRWERPVGAVPMVRNQLRKKNGVEISDGDSGGGSGVTQELSGCSGGRNTQVGAGETSLDLATTMAEVWAPSKPAEVGRRRGKNG
jgi:hypothetical protein